MRRLPILLIAVLALALFAAGCGGDDDSGSPLDNALGYAPSDAPFVFVMSTDVEGDDYEGLNDLAQRFPFGGQAAGQAKNSLEQAGIDYDEDIKPILGNDLVLAVPRVEEFQQDDSGFVLALEAEDGDKAEELAQKDTEEVGESEGAKIYETEAGGTFIAYEDNTLVLSNSQDDLEAALETREGDDRLTEDDFNEAFDDLPEDALVRMYGDAQKILEESPGTEQARKVPWVAGMRKFGATMDADGDGVSVEFDIQTEDVDESALPIASGAESPGIVERANEIGFALRNPAQIVKFGEGAAQAADPQGFGDYQAGKERIGRELDIDVDDDVIAQFEGDAAASVALDGSFAVRSELRDPAAMQDTLDKLADNPEFLEGLADGGSVEPPSGGEDLFGVVTGDGDQFVFGVVNDVFVLANDPDRAEQIAAGDPAAVDGAEGAFALKADAEAIANQAIQQLGGAQLAPGLDALGGAGAFTGPLGDLTGSLQAETDGLRGSFTLSVGD